MASPILPFIGIGLSVVAVLLYIVATATNAWSTGENVMYGLWKICGSGVCLSLPGLFVTGTFHFVRFALITSILVAVVALVFPLLVFLKKLDKLFMKISGGLIIGTGVLVLCGTIAYAVKYGKYSIGFSIGYSLIFAWVSVVFAIAGGILVLMGGFESSVNAGKDASPS